MENYEIIKQKLETIGEDPIFLKPFMMDYIIKIENIISIMTQAQKDAIKELKSNNLSASYIANELNISRTTLYNHNQLLKRYIDHSERLFSEDNPFIAYENLKVDKGNLQEQISLMQDRDISIEILKYEKSELINKLKEKDTEIERLGTRVHVLSNELHQIRVTSPTKEPSTVSKFKKK